MSDAAKVYAFDTGPLRHFALEGWLAVLKFVTRDGRVIIPESVEQELKQQCAGDPELVQVLKADWIHVERRTDVEYLRQFAAFERLLVDNRGRNRGECGVLALGKVTGYVVVIDDGVARKQAKKHDLVLRGTLGLLCQAIREKQLTVTMVEQLADDLLAGDYHLPFERGRFRNWATEQGLL